MVLRSKPPFVSDVTLTGTDIAAAGGRGIRSVAAIPHHAAGLHDQPDVVQCCGQGGAVWGEGRDR